MILEITDHAGPVTKRSRVFHDLAIVGFETETVNFLRLWSQSHRKNLILKFSIKEDMLKPFVKKPWRNHFQGTLSK